MKLHALKPAKGATGKSKRIGRGQGSGKGGTATKGTKGAQSRSGYKTKMAHEGGQMPIQRRVPKRGFKNNNHVAYKVFNLGQVEQLAEKYAITEFSFVNLYINNLVAKTDLIKILGNGELKGKYSFRVNAVSKKAKEAIEAAGGTVEIIK
ncbi:MAG: 50S ribosomal protein L15 [Chitinophagaceae bacterium]|nr:50S ribosomal protein L15 [Chitinophagaceae bacterium]MCB0741630.1 50S ribosomal protein L15 [Chitinophagaceae bacterium]HQU56411.1 50S ribosomal protein L15 [Chitinophagaceae bacterium]